MAFLARPDSRTDTDKTGHCPALSGRCLASFLLTLRPSRRVVLGFSIESLALLPADYPGRPEVGRNGLVLTLSIGSQSPGSAAGRTRTKRDKCPGMSGPQMSAEALWASASCASSRRACRQAAAS